MNNTTSPRTSLPSIIGISGFKRNGKDTVADYLVEHYGYQKIAFADPIKEMCKTVFGFSDQQLNTDLKEATDSTWNISPRLAMQFVGTELFRDQINQILPDVGSNIWCRVLQNKIRQNPDTRFVVSDVRFPNELGAIRELGNTLLLRVNRNIATNNDPHRSEICIPELQVDHDIDNNDTLENLYNQIDHLIAEEGVKGEP